MNSMTEQSYPLNYAGLSFKRSLLVFIVILFFCDIAIYLSLVVSARLEPQYWIGLLVVLTGLLAWFSPETRWQVLRTPVFLWCVLFFGLTLIFYIAVHASHLEQLKERLRDVVLLTTFLAAFLMMAGELSFLKKLILVAVFLGVVINLISIFHNGFLPPPDIKWAHRPTGFYPNPNESGIALIFGMILSLEALPKSWRPLFAVFVLAGVLATFSREAVLGWIVAVACLGFFGVIGWKSTIAYVVLLGLCGAVVSMLAVKAHLIHVDVLDFYKIQVGRFWAVFTGISHDPSSVDRLKVLKLGWAAFLAHPFVGNGIGYTYHWSMPISTHNMYLLYMDDYGVIGFFLYPLLIWCMIRGAVGETRRLAWTMAIFLLFWGFFDHNIVQNYYSLFAISLTAAMVWLSRKDLALKSEPVPARAGSG